MAVAARKLRRPSFGVPKRGRCGRPLKGAIMHARFGPVRIGRHRPMLFSSTTARTSFERKKLQATLLQANGSTFKKRLNESANATLTYRPYRPCAKFATPPRAGHRPGSQCFMGRRQKPAVLNRLLESLKLEFVREAQRDRRTLFAKHVPVNSAGQYPV